MQRERWTSEIQTFPNIKDIFFVVGRVGKFECVIQTYHSNTNCMNSSFKVHLMLSVLTLGFIFLEEIEPCHFEIPNF